MTPRSIALKNQRDWASSWGLNPDTRGYLSSVEKNLFTPLSRRAKSDLTAGSGRELEDKQKSPAKLKATHSSAALALNFFDPWTEAENGVLATAFALPQGELEVRFEQQYPTGLPGSPPNLDIVVRSPGLPSVAIESKFTEWMSRKAQKSAPFKPKYFPPGQGVWNRLGLSNTQSLAESIQAVRLEFHYLDAPQLLKHILGLATNCGRAFRLLYLYFEAAGNESAKHRAEISRFVNIVREDVDVEALTYQDLFSKLTSGGNLPSGYAQYMRSRYFSNQAEQGAPADDLPATRLGRG